MNRKLLVDIAERVFWTGAQAAVAALSVAQFDVPPGYIVPIAMALSYLKGIVASHIGDDTSAAALPGRVQ